MDIELLKLAAGLGGGFFIAVIVLMWKRQDDKRHEDYMASNNAVVLSALQANTAALVSLQKTVETLADFAKLEDRIRTTDNMPSRRRGDTA